MPPRQYDLALDMTRLDRITAYDPGDLTLGVEPGIPLRKLAAVLAEHDSCFRCGSLLHSRTIGGTIASGVDTPLRQMYGTARDYVLGMEFVTGEGVPAKSGGRVVKNVTGYDMHKLMIGALGTLGVITKINFRTFPAPSAPRAFMAIFETRQRALDLRHRIARSPLTPMTIEILSPRAAALFSAAMPQPNRARIRFRQTCFPVSTGLSPPNFPGTNKCSSAASAISARWPSNAAARISAHCPAETPSAPPAARGNSFPSRSHPRPPRRS